MANLSLLFGLILGGFFFLVTFGAGLPAGLQPDGRKKPVPACNGRKPPVPSSRLKYAKAQHRDDGETTFSYYLLLNTPILLADRYAPAGRLPLAACAVPATPAKRSMRSTLPGWRQCRVFYNPHNRRKPCGTAAGGGEKTSLGLELFYWSSVRE